VPKRLQGLIALRSCYSTTTGQKHTPETQPLRIFGVYAIPLYANDDYNRWF